jgi:tryptophan-rich sensory protein
MTTIKQLNAYEVIGNIILYLTVGSLVTYNVNIKKAYNFNKTAFSPPSWLFGVVWTLLYILLGIGSAYISKDFLELLNNIQLVCNFSWVIVYFGYKKQILSIILIFIIIVLSLIIIILDQPAGYFYIPYIIWLFYALFLTFVQPIKH